MSENFKERNRDKILEEFEIEGQSAFIVRLDLDNISRVDLQEHSLNIAKTQVGYYKAQATENCDEELLKRKFEDAQLACEERIKALEHMLKTKTTLHGRPAEFVGLHFDNRIVAIAGIKEVTFLPNGRPVFEITFLSTFQEYAKKSLSRKLQKKICEEKMQENPEIVWMCYSQNQKLIDGWRRFGWKVVDVDDQSEHGVAFRARFDHEYLERLRRENYMMAYADPKIHTLNW